MKLHTLLLCAIAFLLTACGGNSAAAIPTLTPPAEAASATAAVAPPTSAPTSTPEAAVPVAATAVPPTAQPTLEAAPTLEPTLAPTTVASAEGATPVGAADDVPLLDENHPAPTAPAATQAAVAASDPVRIEIKAIAMDRSLVAVGLDAKRQPIVPKHDAAWYNLSARPGQGENVVLWGHVLRFKSTPKIAAPFARLKELKPGAAITLYTADGAAHPYRVQRQVWATPDQVEFILPSGTEQLTLVSCIGDKVILDGALEMTNRLVTIAVPAE